MVVKVVVVDGGRRWLVVMGGDGWVKMLGARARETEGEIPN
jgi:hypothetical protein